MGRRPRDPPYPGFDVDLGGVRLMDDLLVEFLTESAESLDQLDMELVKLEQDPNDPELLSNIFRLVHTIKGTCGFLGLPRLESVAHAGENILGKFRDGEIEVTPQGVTLILGCLDRIKELLAALEETEAEPEGDDQTLIAQLNAYADNGGAASAPVVASHHNKKLVPASILMALIGYAVGNYGAFLAAELCYRLSY